MTWKRLVSSNFFRGARADADVYRIAFSLGRRGGGQTIEVISWIKRPNLN